MKFIVKQNLANPVTLMRRWGYHPIKGGESFVRLLARSAFPRFHIYFKSLSDGLEISLHLDQKKPTYQENKAHSGENQGDILEKEKQRIIKTIL